MKKVRIFNYKPKTGSVIEGYLIGTGDCYAVIKTTDKVLKVNDPLLVLKLTFVSEGTMVKIKCKSKSRGLSYTIWADDGKNSP